MPISTVVSCKKKKKEFALLLSSFAFQFLIMEYFFACAGLNIKQELQLSLESYMISSPQFKWGGQKTRKDGCLKLIESQTFCIHAWESCVNKLWIWKESVFKHWLWPCWELTVQHYASNGLPSYGEASVSF